MAVAALALAMVMLDVVSVGASHNATFAQTCASQAPDNTGGSIFFDMLVKTETAVISEVRPTLSFTGSLTMSMYYRKGSYTEHGDLRNISGWSVVFKDVSCVVSSSVTTIAVNPPLELPPGPWTFLLGSSSDIGTMRYRTTTATYSFTFSPCLTLLNGKGWAGRANGGGNPYGGTRGWTGCLTSACHLDPPDPNLDVNAEVIVSPNCTELGSLDENVLLQTVADDLGVPRSRVVLVSLACDAGQIVLVFRVLGGVPSSPQGPVAMTTGTWEVTRWEVGASPESSASASLTSSADATFPWLYVILAAAGFVLCASVAVAVILVLRNRSHDDSIDLPVANKLEMTEPRATPMVIVEEKIGEGQFGVCYRGHLETDNTAVAVKELSVAHMSPQAIADMHEEAATLALCAHPFAVRYYFTANSDRVVFESSTESTASPESVFMVMELCQLGSLLDVIQMQSFPFSAYLHMAWQTAVGMSALHEQFNVLHRYVFISDAPPHSLMTHAPFSL
jgi:Protein kinase domain